VPEGPAFAALQRGEPVAGGDGTVTPEQVVGEARPGRRLVITGDTRPCAATAEAAQGAELLVHDASFAAEEAQRAIDTGHSTVVEAAEMAAAARVQMLALVHISSRYHVKAVLEEARAVFERTIAPRDFDQIEVPFAERGAPELVANGARERREAPENTAFSAEE
jgi:ribonuclease Z